MQDRGHYDHRNWWCWHDWRNIVKHNSKGINDILVVDNLKNGKKFQNLVDLEIADYMDRDDFLAQIMAGDDFGSIDAVFHEGACSATTEWRR